MNIIYLYNILYYINIRLYNIKYYINEYNINEKRNVKYNIIASLNL